MINFRKIASVLASTVMVGSTVALAAAANFSDPFVKNGVADVAVVWGATAAQTDLVAVTDITSKLSTDLASQTASGTSDSTSTSTISGGDFVKIAKDTDQFNMGNKMSDIYSSLDSDQLSTVLKSGVFTNNANSDFDYDQKINLGGATLTHIQDDKTNGGNPFVGFHLVNGDHIMNYTLEFTPDNADNTVVFGTTGGQLETSDLPMLGRTYYIQNVEQTANGVKLTLLDSANSAIITEGETKTVTVGSNSYDISIVFISTSEVKLNVNGVTTNNLENGGVYKVAADTYVAVKNIMARDKTGTTDKVEVSIGSGKISLENKKEVEMNEEVLSNIKDANGDRKYLSTLTAYIQNDSTSISSIVLSWDAKKDIYVLPGSDLVLPGFETIKMSMGGFNTPKKEITDIQADGTSKYKISTFDSRGAVDFDLLYLNATKTGIAGMGESATQRLTTSSTNDIMLNLSKNDMFVASYANGQDSESYLLQLTDIDGTNAAKNTTTLQYVSDGTEKTFDVGQERDYGNIKLTVNSANYNTGMVELNVTSGAGAAYAALDTFITKEGLTFTLPVDTSLTANAANVATGGFNMTAQPASWTSNFTEEDKDGNNAKGGSFTVTLGHTTDNKATVSSIDSTSALAAGDFLSSSSNSDVKEGYVKSDLATKITWDTSNNQNTAEIEYHGSQASEDVFISESMASVIADQGNGGATGVQSLGSVSVKDSEIASVNTKNLIVVGGSCVNMVAAKLLGSDTAICGDAFTAKTGVAAGQYLIKTFASPYSSNKVATLVAGFNAGDTSNAAKFLTTNVVDTTVGKGVMGTSATSATVITA